MTETITLYARVPAALAHQVDTIIARRRGTMQPANRSDLIREALVDLCQREAGARRVVVTVNRGSKP